MAAFPLCTTNTLWGDAVTTWETRMMTVPGLRAPIRVIYCETRFDDRLSARLQAEGFTSTAQWPRFVPKDVVHAKVKAHVEDQIQSHLANTPIPPGVVQ